MTIEVNWIKGSINPPEDGRYFRILRANEDILNLSPFDEVVPEEKYSFRKGDYMLDEGYWYLETEQWSALRADSPYWDVEAWAYIQKPPIPKEIMPRVKWYFGEEINADDAEEEFSQPHGKWVEHSYFKNMRCCSICGYGVSIPTYNYCPMCGAVMDESEEDE